MKNIVTLFIVFALLAFGFVYVYLSKYATKADVFTWENTYHIHMPLWMQELPKMTGDVEGMYESHKAMFSGEIGAAKVSIKEEFNSWLSDMEEEAKAAARKKAHDMIDAQFGTGAATGKK